MVDVGRYINKTKQCRGSLASSFLGALLSGARPMVDYLGWQLLDQPFLFYFFSSFHPSVPRFPHGVYNSCAVSCASSPLFRPLPSYPLSRSCSRSHPCPRSHLRYYSHFLPHSRPRSHPVFIHGSPLPSPSPFPPRSRSRPRSHHALLRSPPPPFPFPSPLHPRPRSRPQPCSHLRSRPRLRFRS